MELSDESKLDTGYMFQMNDYKMGICSISVTYSLTLKSVMVTCNIVTKFFSPSEHWYVS